MINQLIANIKKTGAPIVVGLDPMLKYIPEHIQKKAFAEFGETLEGAAEAKKRKRKVFLSLLRLLTRQVESSRIR